LVFQVSFILEGYPIVAYSVQVVNNSGAAQYIAIFLVDASGGNEFSLVWMVNGANNGGGVSFSWDPTDFRLGWGSTPQPLSTNVLFTSGQPATAVFPATVGGYNVLPVLHNQYGFSSGNPYNKSSIYNKLEIITDSSFTVSDANNMAVALYVEQYPALAMQGAPNTIYYFDTAQISYYLTVTDFALGVALPQMSNSLNNRRFSVSGSSMSTPVKIAFGPGSTDLKYILNGNLNFLQV
jgi:rhizosphere induced protein